MTMWAVLAMVIFAIIMYNFIHDMNRTDGSGFPAMVYIISMIAIAMLIVSIVGE